MAIQKRASSHSDRCSITTLTMEAGAGIAYLRSERIRWKLGTSKITVDPLVSREIVGKRNVLPSSSSTIPITVGSSKVRGLPAGTAMPFRHAWAKAKTPSKQVNSRPLRIDQGSGPHSCLIPYLDPENCVPRRLNVSNGAVRGIHPLEHGSTTRIGT